MIARIVRLGLTLMVVGMVAALGLGLTYTVTKERIAEQQKKAESEACIEAMPGVESASRIKEDSDLARKARKRVPDVRSVFVCGTGYIITVKAKGYGGPIIMAVGIGKDGKVSGLSVISHNETPGLGGNLVKPGFLDQFKGKTDDDKLVVGEDVEAITGATITSKAVSKEVKEALDAFEAFRNEE